MSPEDAVERVKMAIDSQLSGEFDDVFGPPGEIKILGHNADVVFVRTAGGDFGIFADGHCEAAVCNRVH